MICVDASVVVRLVVEGTPGTVWYEAWSGWLGARERLVAPSLLPCEVTNALHRYVVAGHLSAAEADAALDAALGLGIELETSPLQHGHAARLARRLERQATYDAHYLAVAELTGSLLYTADKRLHAAVGERLPWVRLLEG